MKIIPVILSGGAGTRLWPVSREAHPKPFMHLPDGQSLLQKTMLRAGSLPDVVEVLTVTNREYYFKTKDDYQALGRRLPQVPCRYLLEPLGRNTAPAILMAARLAAARHGEDAVLLILPADHLIDAPEAFAAAVQTAVAAAEAGSLVTFGITPTHPETGYGYIEAGAALPNGSAHHIARFVEKPDLPTAEAYIASGRYSWNSGMFAFRCDRILAALAEHAPELAGLGQACWDALGDVAAQDMLELPKDSFARLPDISIDYAVMEHTKEGVVVPGHFVWNDIGSWPAYSSLLPPDAAGNTVEGEALLFDVQNSYIHSEERLIAAIGVDNLLIVDTVDALLVADKTRHQDVKLVVQKLKQLDHDAYKLHRTVARPWGTYTVLEEGERFKIKRIVVKPGASLSLQMHHHRSEHWIVVSGMAKVVNGDADLMINTNESTFIPAGHKHRLENPGKIDLVMIEVQSGEYLGEDDIVRFEDVYGRVK